MPSAGKLSTGTTFGRQLLGTRPCMVPESAGLRPHRPGTATQGTQASKARRRAPHLLLTGGGWGIRTPEGLHPTRFPSVRHRPTRRILRGGGYRPVRPEAARWDSVGLDPGGWPGPLHVPVDPARVAGVSSDLLRLSRILDATPRAASPCRTPPGPEGSKGKRALTGARGVVRVPGVAASAGPHSCRLTRLG